MLVYGRNVALEMLKNPKKVQEIAESIAQMFDKLNEVNESGRD